MMHRRTPVLSDREAGKVLLVAIFILLLGGLIVAGALYLGQDPESPETPTPGPTKPGSLPDLGEFQRRLPLEGDTVVLDDFEYGKEESLAWGGGNLDFESPLSGEASYSLAVLPELGGRLYCRPGHLPADFSRHPRLTFLARTDGPPVLLRVVFLGRERGQKFFYEGLVAREHVAPLELDLERLPPPLRQNLASIQIESMELPERPIQVSLDDLKLTRGERPVASLPLSRDSGSGESSPVDARLPGEFDEGLAFWEAVPAARPDIPLWIQRGDRALEGGPSLGFGVAERAALHLRSGEIRLPPGTWKLEAWTRGRGEALRWTGNLQVLTEETWAVASTPGGPSSVDIESTWVRGEVLLVVPKPRLDLDGTGEARCRVELEVTGRGHGLLDRIHLVPAEAPGDPGTPEVAAWSRQTARATRPPAWRPGATFLEADGRAFPVLHEQPFHPLRIGGRDLTRNALAVEGELAIRLSEAVQPGELATAIDWVKSLEPHGEVGAFIIARHAGDSSRDLAPSVLRRLRDGIQEIDSRLVLLGLDGDLDPPDSGKTDTWPDVLDAVDAVVAGARTPVQLTWASLEDYRLRLADRLARIDGVPILAEAIIGPSWQVNELQLGLAIVEGAAGLLARSREDVPPDLPGWRKTLEGFRKLQEELAGLSRAPARASSDRVRVAGFTGEDRTIVVLVHLSERAAKEVRIELGERSTTLDLEPWEFRRIVLEE